MTDAKRFRYDPTSPLQLRADALALAEQRFHADLIRARRERGLTQQDVAERLGVSQPTVAAFERYDNDPRLSTIIRYAHGVGVLIDFDVTPDRGQLVERSEWKQFRTMRTPVSIPEDRARLQEHLAPAPWGTFRTDFATAA